MRCRHERGYLSLDLVPRHLHLVILGIVSVLLLWGGASSAQSTSGRIGGTVTDAGSYVFTELPIRNYAVVGEATGFKPYVATNLKLLVDLTLSVDIRLEVG